MARGTLSLRGDSSRELLAITGKDFEISDGPYSGTAQIELTQDSLSLSNLQIVGADSDLSGSLALHRGTVPRLDMDLRSEQMYLPFLWPEPEPEDADSQSGTQTSLAEPPSRKQLAERVIPDTPLPLDWLNRIDGRWQYRLDRLVANEDLVSKLALDLEIDQGRLQTRELSWQGKASTGWMNLTINAAESDSVNCVTVRILSTVSRRILPLAIISEPSLSAVSFMVMAMWV